MAIHVAPLLLCTAVTAALGTPLRQDGFTLRPPESFRLARMALFQGTKAGAVAMDGEDERYLAAALSDGEGEGAATMMVAVVGAPFEATPAGRDAFTTAAMKHFSEELGLPLSLVRSELVASRPPRVQVLATLKQQDQLRTVVVAAMEGRPRHAVITFSIPSARFEGLWPEVVASLDSFRPDPNAGAPLPRSMAAPLLVVLALGLFASWLLWKRRRRFRRADAGLPG